MPTFSGTPCIMSSKKLLLSTFRKIFCGSTLLFLQRHIMCRQFWMQGHKFIYYFKTSILNLFQETVKLITCKQFWNKIFKGCISLVPKKENWTFRYETDIIRWLYWTFWNALTCMNCADGSSDYKRLFLLIFENRNLSCIQYNSK